MTLSSAQHQVRCVDSLFGFFLLFVLSCDDFIQKQTEYVMRRPNMRKYSLDQTCANNLRCSSVIFTKCRLHTHIRYIFLILVETLTRIQIGCNARP